MRLLARLAGPAVLALVATACGGDDAAATTTSVAPTSTVRDMLMGTQFRFESAGPHQLAGFDEPWMLYAAGDGT